MWFPAIYKRGEGIDITSQWIGSPSEYNSLSSKDNNTIYKTYYNGSFPSAEYIGSMQIFPTDLNASDYDIFLSYYSPIKSEFDTGFAWINANFEITFSLANNNYSGTQVLISSTSGVNFNIILNNTQLRLYTTGHNQTVIDTIQANTKYRIVKTGQTITIYRENTQLVTATVSGTAGTLHCYAWNNGYFISGGVNYITIKENT